MHGPSPSTLPVAILLGLLAFGPARADTPEALAEARRKLDAGDGIAAVSALEDALPGARPGPSRDAVLDLLRRAYEVAARQADGQGRPLAAETYRENSKILNRKGRPARPAPDPTPTPTPAGVPSPSPVEPGPVAVPTPASRPRPTPTTTPTPTSTPARSSFAEAPSPESQEPPIPLPEGPSPPPEDPTLVPAASVPGSAPAPEPDPIPKPAETAPLLPMPAPKPSADVASGDAAFAAKDYRQAGRIYGELAREKRLPADRRDHWLYCRASDVVDRINAGPKTPAEWASLNAEIDQIKTLNPKIWLGEYLQDLAEKRQAAQKKAKLAKAVVVRGSAPEEPARVDRPVRAASGEAPAPAPPPAPAALPIAARSPLPEAARIGTASGRWQVRESANFKIYHADPALAEKVAAAAEATRRDVARRWAGQEPPATWQPACEIYLYPTAGQYARMTGQPEDSPGFSTMGMNAGRIIARRVNLRVDHPSMLRAVLPHEVTHVILADLFPTQQIPRWADEGLAVLSEPVDEQRRRAQDLAKPLADNRLFPVQALMGMEYPDERYWALYYAQSVSLSRFLVEQGSTSTMIQFLRAAQAEGDEAALRKVYGIEGYDDLQNRWLAYARSKAEAPNTASNPKSATAPDLKVR